MAFDSFALSNGKYILKFRQRVEHSFSGSKDPIFEFLNLQKEKSTLFRNVRISPVDKIVPKRPYFSCR